MSSVFTMWKEKVVAFFKDRFCRKEVVLLLSKDMLDVECLLGQHDLNTRFQVSYFLLNKEKNTRKLGNSVRFRNIMLRASHVVMDLLKNLNFLSLRKITSQLFFLHKSYLKI